MNYRILLGSIFWACTSVTGIIMVLLLVPAFLDTLVWIVNTGSSGFELGHRLRRHERIYWKWAFLYWFQSSLLLVSICSKLLFRALTLQVTGCFSAPVPLTLLPQGDIGGVILSIDLEGISAFLIIISFILVYLFKLKFIDKKIKL